MVKRKDPGSDLLFQALASLVPSVQEGLTAGWRASYALHKEHRSCKIDLRGGICMSKHKEQMIPVTLHLTPEQVEALLRQVTGAEEDWMDDPRILRTLAERDRQVAAELRAGKFATLTELQGRWRKRQAKAKS